MESKAKGKTLTKTEEKEPIDFISVNFTQDLIQDVASLFNRPKLHDVLFQTPSGDDIAVAHKTILGARSSYWHNYFSIPPKGNTSVLNVSLIPKRTLLADEDVEVIVIEEPPEAFLSVLKYIYSNRYSHVPLEILPSVIALANKYDLCELVANATKKIQHKDKKTQTQLAKPIDPFLDVSRLPCEEGKISVYPSVSFEVEEHIFHASPLLLMARSNYFATMFCYGWSECASISHGEEKKKAPILLQTIPSNDFKLILQFAHTGQITLNSSGQKNLAKLFSFIEWGIFYQMKSFLFALSQLIYTHYVNPKSVCLIWNQAEDYADHDMGDLAEKCLEFFQQKFVACTTTAESKENFFHLKKHLLKAALDSGLINADYRVMSQVIREWAQANALRLGETADSLELQLLPPSTLFNLENRYSVLGVGPRPTQLPRFLAAV